jgi:hypothetical protein
MLNDLQCKIKTMDVQYPPQTDIDSMNEKSRNARSRISVGDDSCYA